MDTVKTFSPGARIITKDDPAACAWLVMDGKIRVSMQRDGRRVDLAELGRGAIVGETSLFGGKTYGADVDAVESSDLMMITPEEFGRRIRSADPMVKAIVDMLIDRLKKTNEALLRSETREFMDIGFDGDD